MRAKHTEQATERTENRLCIHCQHPIDAKAWICPECGKVQHPELPTAKLQTEPVQVAKRKRLMKRPSDDRLLGSVIAVLIPLFSGFIIQKFHLYPTGPRSSVVDGIIVAFSANIVLWLVGYFLLRRRYPDMGDAFRTVALVLGIGFPLGAFGNCIGLALGSMWGGH